MVCGGTIFMVCSIVILVWFLDQFGIIGRKDL
jgi:hypothetical protein